MTDGIGISVIKQNVDTEKDKSSSKTKVLEDDFR